MPGHRERLGSTVCLLFMCGAMVSGTVASGDVLMFLPIRDNTLIDVPEGTNSNALGDGIYSGRTGVMSNGTRLRGVLAFDLSGIPEGSTVQSASLMLTLIQSSSDFQVIAAHRLLTDWGEGTSEGTGGQGGPASKGDATWLHTFFPGQFWTNPGGDFIGTPSATQSVGFVPGSTYEWTSEQFAADVQSWVECPASNFGWILVGNESQLQTTKKFASKDFTKNWPQLMVEYAPGTPCPADIAPPQGDGVVNVSDLLAVIGAWGDCVGSGPCCAADIAGGDFQVNVNDLLAVISQWGPCD